MIIRQWGLAWLAGAAAMAATGPASAETTRVELRLSGPTWHAAACPHENPFGTARCHARIVTDARGTPIDGKARANRRGTPNAVPAGYGPADIKAAYAIPAGSGAPVIAIVDAYGYAKAESDLAVYRSQFGLAACTTANGCFKKVNQTGGTNYPRDNIGWAQEQALDLDMASAACPNCKIVLVQAKSASFSDLMAAVSYAKTIPGIRAISNSYGGTDSTSMAQYDSVYSGNNIAITASTGDSGYGAQYPATSSGVIAVGGTSLSRGGSGFSESAWSGAGSGCGLGHSKPSWQGGVTDACAGRMEADISAVADPNTGVAVYGPRTRSSSGWMIFGGTSASAPLVGAMFALRNGNINGASSIYANNSALHDVTTGSNGTSCPVNYYCKAGAGFDGPTGLGTPNGLGALSN